eukprot:scaffold210147_cov33-Prasinocladus_malaysianus.AAC.1
MVVCVDLHVINLHMQMQPTNQWPTSKPMSLMVNSTREMRQRFNCVGETVPVMQAAQSADPYLATVLSSI